MKKSIFRVLHPITRNSHASALGILLLAMFSFAALDTPTVYAQAYYYTVQNSFGSGGVVYDPSPTLRYPPYTNAYVVPNYPVLTAITPQTIGGYTWQFKRWLRNGSPYYAPNQTIVVRDDGATYTAEFGRIFQVTLTQPTSCAGISRGTYLWNGVDVGSQYSTTVLEGNTVLIEFVPLPGCMFIQWSDGNSDNPRFLTPTGHISNLHAIYAEHLVSDKQASDVISEGPTSVNNQRKLDYDEGTGIYHSVYESCGEVWYISSSNGGNDWTPEIRVSYGQGTASVPSIDVEDGSIFITYAEDNEIIVGKWDPSGWWNWSYAFNKSVPWVTPVVIAYIGPYTERVLLAMEGEGYPGQFNILVEYFVDGQHADSEILGGNWSVYPAVVFANSYSNIEIVWREGSEILHAALDDGGYPYYLYVVYGYPQVVDLNGLPAVGAPSLTRHKRDDTYNDVVMAVELGEPDCLSLYPWSYITIVHWDWFDWNTVQTFFTGNETDRIWAPSVNCLNELPNGSVDHIRCAINYTDDYCPGSTVRQVHVINFEGGQWSSDMQLDNTLHPSTVEFPAPGVGLDQATEFDPAPPYSIVHSNYMLNKTQPLERARELVLRKDKSELRVRLADFAVNNGGTKQELEWMHPYGAFKVGKNISIEEDFRTKAFTINQGSTIEHLFGLRLVGQPVFPKNVSVRLELVDASSNTVIATLDQTDAGMITTDNLLYRKNHRLSAGSNRSVYVRLSVTGLDESVTMNAADYYNITTGSDKRFPDGTVMGTVDNTVGIPTTLTLEQNYPNPFNPSTEIAYSIPEDGFVRLEVFDNLGRSVGVLVSTTQKAGSYRVQFDGTQLPSGVYRYILGAGNSQLSGTMHLMK